MASNFGVLVVVVLDTRWEGPPLQPRADPVSERVFLHNLSLLWLYMYLHTHNTSPVKICFYCGMWTLLLTTLTRRGWLMGAGTS